MGAQCMCMAYSPERLNGTGWYVKTTSPLNNIGRIEGGTATLFTQRCDGTRWRLGHERVRG